MTAAVELDLLLQTDQGGDVVGLGGRDLSREGGIQVVDVGLVVLCMMQLHDLLGDDRLKGLKGTVSSVRPLGSASTRCLHRRHMAAGGGNESEPP